MREERVLATVREQHERPERVNILGRKMKAMDEKTAIFGRNFIIVSLINLLVMVVYFLLFVISSPYAVERFGASPSISGLVAGLMVLGSLAGRFVCGKIIENARFRRVLFIGLAIFIFSIGLYLLAGTLPFLLAVRFTSGIGVGCIGTVTGTLVAHIVPPNQRGLGLSYFSLGTVVALAAGPFLGIFLLERLDYPCLFFICLLLGIFCLLMALFLNVSIPEGEGEERPARLFALSDYIEIRAVPICFVVLLVGFCYGNVQAFISTYAGELGLGEAASVFFLFYTAVVFVTRPLTGRIIDARGENIVAYPALLLMALGFLLFALADSAPLLLLSGALLGAGVGNIQSIAQVAAIKMASCRKRYGQATSTFFIFLDLGIGFGPYLLGLLVPKFGYSGLFMVTALIAFLAFPAYFLLYGRKQGGRSNSASV